MSVAEETALRRENRRLTARLASLESEIRLLKAALKATEPKTVTPTPMMRKLLAFIADYQRTHDGVSPSYQEMADGLGVATKSGIHRLVTGLEERGAIQRLPHRARAMTIVATLSHEEPR